MDRSPREASTERSPTPHAPRRPSRLHLIWLGLVLASTAGCTLMDGPPGSSARPAPEPAASSLEPLHHDVRQLTFAGRRSGEGYFSRDGRQIVFQSEREPGNPFYQIYRMDLVTGETTRVSTGRGRTTCAWIHPEAGDVLFASTHLDPEALDEQRRELEERAGGGSRRYAWGFDEHYDLFLARTDGTLERITDAPGYDAEGSFSPDGRTIVFASNRHAYGEALTPEQRERLAEDPSFFIDLYLLDVESGRIRRLTRSPGYDGGPFFSPDGERIVWRRFSEDGARAEIHSARLDGGSERVLTRLGVMSWAPFYHPSGDYVIFTTNRHGYENFELYLVDARGLRDPVRVTTREGFDGLPVFSPAGDRLLWTSNRTSNGTSQLFVAEWDDAAAREALALEPAAAGPGDPLVPLPDPTHPHVRVADLEGYVAALTDPRMEGRRAGEAGAAVAAEFLERAMAAIGLEPAGDESRYLHRFDFTAGISLGPENRIALRAASDSINGSGPTPDSPSSDASAPDTPAPVVPRSAASTQGGGDLPGPGSLEIGRDWQPLAFSRRGEVEPSRIVFAGYGLVAPASDGLESIDAYEGLDVEDRWVMVFRGLPHSLEGEARQHLQRHASLRHKAMIARDRGARGILFVSGPLGRFREELIPLRFDASLAGSRIAALSLADDLADRLLRGTGSRLRTIQERTDASLGGAGFVLPGVELGARIDLVLERTEGANVIGRLQVGHEPSGQTIVLGAHYDHLGRGEGSSSLATSEEMGRIHPGADDNASGVAVLLEIAEELAHRRERGADLGTRDLVFAAWGAEEVGLIGSSRWVEDFVNPHAGGNAPVAYLNFDMVGRLEESLVVQGLGSSPDWPALLERAAAPLDLRILPQEDSYLPTDATSFYTAGIPILSAFTGVHSEYHTPRDRMERLNLDGTMRIGRLFGRIALDLTRAQDPPTHTAQKAPTGGGARSGFRVFLGTVPDYAQTDVRGVKLSGVAPGGPAEDAGLRAGDVIVEVDGRPIENLYDYTYALDVLRVGEPARIVVEREGERRTFEIVPASRS